MPSLGGQENEDFEQVVGGASAFNCLVTGGSRKRVAAEEYVLLTEHGQNKVRFGVSHTVAQPNVLLFG